MKTVIIEKEYPRIKVRGEDGRVYTIKVNEGWDEDAFKVGDTMELEKVSPEEKK